MFRRKFVMTTLVVMFGVFSISVLSTSAHAGGDWYQDTELKVSFFYSEKFTPAQPAESTTRYVVNWKAKASGGLLATCYLKAFPTDVEEVKGRAYLASDTEEFVQSWVENTKRRASEVDLLEARPVKIDGLQAVYVVMDASIESFDRNSNLRTYSLITFWKGQEIALECGTTVPSVVTGNLSEEQAATAIKNVEDEIWSVLRTLHFERS